MTSIEASSEVLARGAASKVKRGRFEGLEVAVALDLLALVEGGEDGVGRGVLRALEAHHVHLLQRPEELRVACVALGGFSYDVHKEI